MPTDPALIDQLLAGIAVIDAEGKPALGIDPSIADLIDAHPQLLSAEVDAFLAERPVTSPEEYAHLAAVRRVLEVCRTAGSAAPLRDGATAQAASPEATPEGLAPMLSFLQVAETLGQSFEAGGLLRAALAVARTVVLMNISNEPGIDRDATSEAALAELEEGLAILWAVAPSRELARWQIGMGALLQAYRRDDHADNLERAIACFEQALTVYTREADPDNWALAQSHLGLASQSRQRGDQADNIERAIACYEQALTVYKQETAPRDWARIQVYLGDAYNNRLHGDRADNIERAIACFEPVLTVDIHEIGPYLWAVNLHTLGEAYNNRLRGDRTENIERVIACYEQALTAHTQKAAPREWSKIQASLGDAYDERLRGDRAENIERAIMCYEQSLTIDTRDAAPSEWARIQVYLGVKYRDRERGDRAENIERAIAHHEQALTVYTRDAAPLQWALTEINLGDMYGDRQRGDQAENIERAITCHEQALTVDMQEIGPYLWALNLHNLGEDYRNRVRGDRAENIERAITYFERSLTVHTRDEAPLSWASTQVNLGAACGDRLRGDRAENGEYAIACFEQALSIYTQQGTPRDCAVVQNNLGAAYRLRLRGDRAKNIEQAIAYLEQTLTVYTKQATPHDWAEIQDSLGEAYCDRVRGDRAENIERAIAYHEQAVTVHTQEATPRKWGRIQANLGNAYRVRLREDRAENNELAIMCYEQALTVYTRDAALRDWAGLQTNLGIAYNSRVRGDRMANIERAIAYFSGAAPLLQATDPQIALSNLVSAGGLHQELGRGAETRALWQQAMALREQLLSAGSSAIGGEAARLSQELAVRLAQLEVQLGDPQAAVATLERGRATALRAALALDDIWLASLMGDQRVPIVRARDQLEQLRLIRPSAAEGADPGQLRAWEAEIAATQAALKAALATAQAVSGFTPPPRLAAASLAALAPAGGAVVLLAAGLDGGLAFVLSHGCGDAGPEHVVLLPEATTEAMRELLARYLGDVHGAIPAGASLAALILALQGPNAVLEAVLQTLWRTVMGPVLAKAAELGVTEDSELVLIPQGDLALLPLHAAGQMEKGVLHTVLDRHVVSYAPSGAALRTARQRLAALPAATQTAQGGLFGVFNPMRGTKDALPQAEHEELPALQRLFGASARTLVGAEATVAQVLAMARDVTAAFVHLACHGRFDLAEPARSGLQLAGNEMLTVTAIIERLRLVGNRMVVLSACESAMTDVLHLPDEAVGLPAALLQAGTPGVMATLWSVYDRPTSLLVSRFYEQVLAPAKHPGPQVPRPATVLRDTVRWLRAGGSDTADAGMLQAAKAGAATAADTASPDKQVTLADLLRMPIIWAAYSYHGT